MADLLRSLRSQTPYRERDQSYRDMVVKHYDGVAGWLTLVSGIVTGQEAFARRLISANGFDIRGSKMILDIGCGTGRYLKTLVARADHDAHIVGLDLSRGMLRRARHRLRGNRCGGNRCGGNRCGLLVADFGRLPFADRSINAIICGWVLEHAQDPLVGLGEMARVLAPHGKILLLTTEDTIPGAISSRFYHAKTYQRQDIVRCCDICGLAWHREYWLSAVHRRLRLGGIIAELRPLRPPTTAG